MRKARDIIRVVIFVSPLLLILSLSPANATSANISHSYSSSENITNGSLVSLDPEQTNYVEPANTTNGQQLLGIAVASDDSLLAIDPTPNSVQVATSGTADTLVSTINGPISVGDQISVSPIDGLGMKAGQGDYVIGLAQTAFNSSTSSAIQQQVKTKSGKTISISVGFIRLGIAIGIGTNSGGSQLNSLQQFSENLTGHTVSTARVLVSIIIAVITFVALVTLIYATIYSGIISIGRNPLAKYAVFRSMSSVLGMVVLVAVVSSITIYFLLK
jgi:hypothetical protein